MEKKLQTQIELYLNNKLSEEEKIHFEKLLDQDEELKEEIFLQKSLDNVFNDKAIINKKFNDEERQVSDLLRSDKYQNISKQIKKGADDYQKRLKRKTFLRVVRSLAAVSLVFIASTYFLTNSNENYYDDYANWDSLPSFTEKGNSEIIIQKIEDSYKEQNYKLVIEQISTSSDTLIKQTPSLLVYLGASYFHENKYDEALKSFDALITSNTYDNSKGYWYKLLVYLKQNKQEESKEVLLMITSDTANFNYDIASELLMKIK